MEAVHVKTGSIILGGAVLALGAWVVFSGSDDSSEPLTPAPAKPVVKPTPASVDTFTWADGSTANVPPFLDWSPNGISAPVAGPTLPKKGEKYQTLYSVNRALHFYEKSAAQAKMTDQTLVSFNQIDSAPYTVTLVTQYNQDATSPIPIGQTLQKNDITAVLTSAQKLS